MFAVGLVLLAGGLTAGLVLDQDERRPRAFVSALPAIGGAYSLVDHRGGRVTDDTFRGKVQIVFFGFTQCPDVCPTALSLVVDILDALGPEAADVAPLLISVDPERDTPERLAAYVAAFDPRITGLTGTPAEVAAAAKAFRVFYQKAPREDGEYAVDHSATLFVLDRSGAFAKTLDIHEPPETAVEKVRRVVAGRSMAGEG